MQLFVGYGSDTDCDGTQHYIVLFRAEDLDAAWEFVKARGNMTMDGVHNVEPVKTEQLSEQDFRDALSWLNRDALNGVENPYGYCTTGADWQPWVYDDTIGIPALDTRYEED